MLAVFGVGQVLWSMFWFFLFVIWVMLLFWIFADIFRSHTLSGVGKFAWILAVVVLPYVGVFAYLIVRGARAHTVSVQPAGTQAMPFPTYLSDPPPVPADPVQELQRLADLKQRGVITDDEFARMKARIIA